MIEAEVIEVNYSDGSPESIYAIKAKPIDNTTFGGTSTMVTAKPLDLKTLIIPTIGEVVMLYKNTTPHSDASYRIKEYYYTNPINIQNSINHNTLKYIVSLVYL